MSVPLRCDERMGREFPEQVMPSVSPSVAITSNCEGVKRKDLI